MADQAASVYLAWSKSSDDDMRREEEEEEER
jgi:hypothetical protein